VYWEDGAQITPPHDSGIMAEVKKVTDYNTVKTMDKEAAKTAGLYITIGKDVDDAYIESVNKLVYKKKNATEYIERLSKCCGKIEWNLFAKCYANILTEGQAYNIELTSQEDILFAINECKSIIDSVNNEEWTEERFKQQILLSAEAIMIMAENIAVLAGYDVKKESDTEAWVEKYRKAWLEQNKESELKEIEKVFLTINNKIKGDY